METANTEVTRCQRWGARKHAVACKDGPISSASFKTTSEEDATNLKEFNELGVEYNTSIHDKHSQVQCSGIDYLASLPPPSENLLADYRRRNNKHRRRNPVLNSEAKNNKKGEVQHTSNTLHQNTGGRYKIASLNMVKPWVEYHFSESRATAPHETPYFTNNSSSEESIMKQDIVPNQRWENEEYADEETFFSCTERNSNWARQACIKNSDDRSHQEVSKKKASTHRDKADSTCSSLGAVQKQTSQYLSPISFNRNCAMLEVTKSMSSTKSQQSLSAIPLVPNPLVKLSAYQVNKRSSSTDIDTAPSSTTSRSNLTMGAIERPLLAVLPSKSDLNSVSIISIVSYRSSGMISEHVKDSLCNGNLSSSRLSSSEYYLKTGSLLGEIMSYNGNGTVAAFLNGIPLASDAEETKLNSSVIDAGLVIQQQSGPLYSVQRLQYGRSASSMTNSTRDSHQGRISASGESQSTEDMPNVCSSVSSSISASFDYECKKNASISMPKTGGLACPRSKPQIHTSKGKTFLPPELSEVDNKKGCLNSCTYTLVRKTIFNPTRYQERQHDFPYSWLASNTPSISESSSRTLTTKQDQSSTSLFTTPAFEGHGDVPSSVSMFPMQHEKKSNFATSMSCDTITTGRSVQHTTLVTVENDSSVGTSGELDINALKNIQPNIDEAAREATVCQRDLLQGNLPVYGPESTKKKADDLASKVHQPCSSIHDDIDKRGLPLIDEGKKPLHTSRKAHKPTNHNCEAKANKTFKSRVMKVVFHLFRK